MDHKHPILMSLLTIIFLVSLHTIGAIPLNRYPREVDPSAVDNAFDVGPIIAAGSSACVVPTTEVLPICGKHISYPVPEVLLNEAVARIKEKATEGAKLNADQLEAIYSQNDGGNECGDVIEEIECLKKFPSCTNGNTQIEYVTENCTDKIKSACTGHSLLAPSSCDYTNYIQDQPIEIATCTKVSSSPYKYRYCSKLKGWSDVYLTEWMNISIIGAENEIESFNMFVGDSMCTALYAELKCGEAGRCWDQGTRMETNATRETCEAILACVSSSKLSKIKQQLNCSLYPSAADKLATPATEITQPTEPPDPSTTNGTDGNSTDSTETTLPSTGNPIHATNPTSRPPYIHFTYPQNMESGTLSVIRLTLANKLLLLLLLWLPMANLIFNVL